MGLCTYRKVLTRLYVQTSDFTCKSDITCKACDDRSFLYAAMTVLTNAVFGEKC
jgi:hypothetical protein